MLVVCRDAASIQVHSNKVGICKLIHADMYSERLRIRFKQSLCTCDCIEHSAEHRLHVVDTIPSGLKSRQDQVNPHVGRV